MGAAYSLFTDKNTMYYIIFAYFILSVLTIDTPKKEKSFVNEHPSKPRLLSRKRWLESEIQHLQEELSQINQELEEPVLPESMRAAIRSEINQQVREQVSERIRRRREGNGSDQEH
jgi:hypothetical protein